MMLKGVIDSPDIPLNVSRSQLQSDRTVKQVASHVSKKVSDRLATIYKSDKEKFLSNWEDVGMIIKIGAIEDTKFYDRVQDILVWKTSKGEWITAQDYVENLGESENKKVFYASQAESSFVKMYEDKGFTVLLAESPIDTALMQTIEQKLSNVKFQRIDAEISEEILDKEGENTLLDANGKTEAGRLADFIRAELKDLKEVEVEAKSLASKELPAILTLDENMRRFRDHMKLSQGDMPSMPIKSTLVVNTNHPLVKLLPKLAEKDARAAHELTHELYELTRLSQREMEGKELNSFIARTQALLTKLTEKIIG
jgi:molecular chaperone HtpG